VRGMRTLSYGLALVLLLILVVSGTVMGQTKTPPGPPDAPAASASGKSKGDYLPAHTFKIEIDGVISGGFKEISGLESEVEVAEYKDGSDPITRKRPGRTTYSNIIMKLDATDPATREVVAWYNQEAAGKGVRKNMSIIVFNRDDKEVARYNLFEAWPCRWKAPELNSHSDTFIIEEIEFVVEKVERA